MGAVDARDAGNGRERQPGVLAKPANLRAELADAFPRPSIGQDLEFRP
jgi:hypothetical protein